QGALRAALSRARLSNRVTSRLGKTARLTAVQGSGTMGAKGFDGQYRSGSKQGVWRMKRHWKSVTALVAVAAALVFVAVAAGATGGMGNGDFEHGDFTKWTTDATNATAWSVYSGNQTPIIGIP